MFWTKWPNAQSTADPSRRVFIALQISLKSRPVVELLSAGASDLQGLIQRAWVQLHSTTRVASYGTEASANPRGSGWGLGFPSVNISPGMSGSTLGNPIPEPGRTPKILQQLQQLSCKCSRVKEKLYTWSHLPSFSRMLPRFDSIYAVSVSCRS
jgi:hypothetical protein